MTLYAGLSEMVKIEVYVSELLSLLKESFGDRLVYMGLQGSYLRNEQNENSDIDIMAVLDKLSADDLELYKGVLVRVGHYDKACGFICGKEELAAWNPLEVCHLLHTTRDIYGSLSEYLPAYTREDEINFIRLSAGNMYHELCHRYIYTSRENNAAKLPGVYKSCFFILQNLYFTEKGVFYNSKSELADHLEGQDKSVLEMSLKLGEGCGYNFDGAFDLLLSWCQSVLKRLSESIGKRRVSD